MWSSGSPTLATSGATFLDGRQWGAYDGLLVIGLLKAQGVLALRLDEDGALRQQFRLPELDGSHGRIRTAQQGGDGALVSHDRQRERRRPAAPGDSRLTDHRGSIQGGP